MPPPSLTPSATPLHCIRRKSTLLTWVCLWGSPGYGRSLPLPSGPHSRGSGHSGPLASHGLSFLLRAFHGQASSAPSLRPALPPCLKQLPPAEPQGHDPTSPRPRCALREHSHFQVHLQHTVGPHHIPAERMKSPSVPVRRQSPKRSLPFGMVTQLGAAEAAQVPRMACPVSISSKGAQAPLAAELRRRWEAGGPRTPPMCPKTLRPTPVCL